MYDCRVQTPTNAPRSLLQVSNMRAARVFACLLLTFAITAATTIGHQNNGILTLDQGTLETNSSTDVDEPATEASLATLTADEIAAAVTAHEAAAAADAGDVTAPVQYPFRDLPADVLRGKTPKWTILTSYSIIYKIY